MSDLSTRFRRCVGLYPTGVAIVTSAGKGRPAGMTINSFVSVSLDPLLVLVSLHSDSRTLEAIELEPRFAISLLQRKHLEIAVAFSMPRAPFPEDHVRRTDDGVFVIPDALATLTCDANQHIPAGDHTLVLAPVVSFESREGQPLLFYRGTFGTMSAIDERAGFESIANPARSPF
jgi:flavin reductase (DIM6/NTAB) family NADH-FMN oxidoreductase RutF